MPKILVLPDEYPIPTAVMNAAVACVSFQTTTPTPAPNIPAGFNLEQHERWLVERCLEACKDNRQEAAVMLGVSERTLYRKLSSWGLSKARTEYWPSDMLRPADAFPTETGESRE